MEVRTASGSRGSEALESRWNPRSPTRSGAVRTFWLPSTADMIPPAADLIAGPMHIEAESGERRYALSPRPAGGRIKGAVYFLKVLVKSSTNAMVGLRLDHGPEPSTLVTHSNPIATTQLTDPTYATPCVLSGFADVANGQLGEWLQPVVVAMARRTSEWALVEVYELRKRF